MAEHDPTEGSKDGEWLDVFQPLWRDHQRSDGMCLSNDKERRTPHPSIVPQEVLDTTAETYRKWRPRILSADRRSFTLFPKLPPELRLLILTYSLPAGRIVEVLYDNDRGTCKPTCSMPSILRVNQESRSVALKAYKPRFGTSKAPPMTYFDSSVDTLFLGEHNLHPKLFRGIDGLSSANVFFNAISEEDRNSIYRLAIDTTIQEDKDPEQEVYFGLWYLKTITEISSEGNYDITLCNAPRQFGEIHLWSMSPGGRAMPWFLREDEIVEKWEADISVNWSNLEDDMQYTKKSPLITHRCVSQRRLLEDPRFRKRMLYLQNTVRVRGCIYAKDGIIDKIMDWKANAGYRYQELAFLLRRTVGRHYLPEDLYIGLTPCSCPSGHSPIQFLQNPETLPKLGQGQVDFKAAINRVERVWAFEGLADGEEI